PHFENLRQLHRVGRSVAVAPHLPADDARATARGQARIRPRERARAQPQHRLIAAGRRLRQLAGGVFGVRGLAAGLAAGFGAAVLGAAAFGAAALGAAALGAARPTGFASGTTVVAAVDACALAGLGAGVSSTVASADFTLAASGFAGSGVAEAGVAAGAAGAGPGTVAAGAGAAGVGGSGAYERRSVAGFGSSCRST